MATPLILKSCSEGEFNGDHDSFDFSNLEDNGHETDSGDADIMRVESWSWGSSNSGSGDIEYFFDNSHDIASYDPPADTTFDYDFIA